MGIDFNKLTQNTTKTITDPTKIFDVLPDKNEKYAGYLRDVQSEVLKKWDLEGREAHDVVIKMNTGSGKTVVGLLILQSYLNEKKGPCVYVVPDNYLLDQVKQEADDLRIKCTTDINDINFLKGNSILIINMHKLFNGRSGFGVREKKIPINCIVMDDAHSCIDIATEQSTLSISSDQPEYKKIFNLLKDSIKEQSEATYIEIESGSPTAYQAIPFWAWDRCFSEILPIIHAMINQSGTPSEKEIYFKWPLVKDYLHVADSFISSKEISITLPYVPIEKIPSFDQAEHRVFMSATIEDDTKMIEHLNVDPEYVIISPQKASDIGERLILMPQSKDTKIDDTHMKNWISIISKSKNVVVLVPTYRRSNFWEDVADVIVKTGDQLHATVQKLKEEHIGLVVIVNRYDGIDLPKKSCEILVIDSLPDYRSLKDKYEQYVLRGTAESDAKNIRIIEQGMGRAVRSKDDYCVIFLMNSGLIRQLYLNNSIQYFSESTRKQLELSELVQEQVEGNNYTEVISSVLDRDPQWISASKEYIADIEYKTDRLISDHKLEERDGYYLAANENFQDAIAKIQKLTNECTVKPLKGYLKYKLAKVSNFVNKDNAQQLVKSANTLNNQLPKPISGIEYRPLEINNLKQSQRLKEFITANYSNTNKFLLAVNDMITKLKFNDVSSDVFEQAIEDFGIHIGLISQRPENISGKGPDNLWLSYSNHNFVIECKNEATNPTISKKYCNQLNGSSEWFKNQYDSHLQMTPIMIHPSIIFENAASPNKNIKIINEEKLDLLRRQFKSFSEEIADTNFDLTAIDRSLRTYNFNTQNFSERYTLDFKSIPKK